MSDESTGCADDDSELGRAVAAFMTRRNPTPTQRAACLFVAALAEDVDARSGVFAHNGTPETRTKVANLVKERFFESPKTIEGEVL